MSQTKFIELKCIGCGRSFPTETHLVCSTCGSILTGEYMLDEKIDLDRRDSIWQFRKYFAPIENPNVVSMGEGWTPLVVANNFAAEIGLDSNNFLCKMEGQNPTGSFKDRPSSLSVSLAKQWKKKGIFLASSGNAAASTAAYCAAAKLNCLVLLKDDSTVSKLSQIAMYNPYLLRVKELYRDTDSLDETFRMTQDVLQDWLNGFIWARYNPLVLDALKTIAYEIAAVKSEPDYVFVPTAGGDLIFGLYKGFQELKNLDQIKEVPKLVAVQGSRPSPTVDAIEAARGEESKDGQNESGKQEDTDRTIAGALSSNMPSEHAVFSVKKTGGFGVRVSNQEIIRAQRLASKSEGIFCEASSAVTLAAAAKALSENRVQGDEKVCAIVTGTGFKDFYPTLKDTSQIPYAGSSEKFKVVLASMFSTS